MSIGLTRILQQITGLNTFFQGPNAGRMNGVVLEDSDTVTWSTDGFGNVQAAASASALPTGSGNKVIATPANGSSGVSALRALVSADLPVGSASQLGALQVDGTTITATAGVISAAAPASAMTLIAENATGSFSSIPQTFTHLMLAISATSSGGGGAPGLITLTFNGDSSFLYSNGYIQNSNATITGVQNNTASNIICGVAGGSGSNGTSNVTISNYKSTTTKSLSASGIGEGNALLSIYGGGVYSNTTAITSLALATGNGFAANSTFSLYGLK